MTYTEVLQLIADITDYLIDTSEAIDESLAIDLLRRLNTYKHLLPAY